jgi:nucleoside-diphosphate-sugar epimerase
MRVLVTGAAGFIGQALTAALREPAAQADAAHACASPPTFLLTDRLAPRTALPSTRWMTGDIADPTLHERLFAEQVDTVFHLAGVVSGAAEVDYALGKRVNLDATIALLERCREQVSQGGPAPRFVYASSIAVFGTPLPARIDDSTASHPTLSYGAHKRACELLIDDCSRRGFIDGRALRLSGVVVRPPLANGALSGFNSDLIREPLAGRDYVCPVAPKATIWIVSLGHAIANLIRLADAPASALGPQRAMTTPSLALPVAAIVAALAKADPSVVSRIRFDPNPAIEAQFGRWPLDCAFDRGTRLGLTCDASIDDVIRTHLELA